MKFKFITLNLWLGGILFDAILKFLKKEKPDILVCQEAFDSKDKNLERRYHSFEVLKKELNFPYAVFAATFSQKVEDGKAERGNAVFSRFPILDNKITFFDIPYRENYIITKDGTYTPRNLQWAVLETDKIKLNVFNAQGIWGLDGKDNDRRLKMAETIIKEIKNKKNVILAGDFNVNQGTRTIANIGKHLKEIFKNELVNTFNLKRKPKPSNYSQAVVDRIFVSKNIKALERYCPKVDISDHLPLVAVLAILK